MSVTKVTLLFSLTTVDKDGNAARAAGWSESYLNALALDSGTLQLQWTSLAQKRAALLPANARISGSRFQLIDPIGGSRSYDNVYNSGSSAINDLPSLALQWTVRSKTTSNQRSLILRGIPDGRVSSGEYVPAAAYSQSLLDFFAELKANWLFRCIDRTILPAKIISITDAGLVTTASPHGLVANDTAIVMSAINGRGVRHTEEIIVLTAPTTSTFTVFIPRLGRDENPQAPFIFSTVRGKVRKKVLQYVGFDINNEEILNPTAITRKAGRPSRVFRGRRTARR